MEVKYLAKVLKTFRERYQDFKRYDVGDEYPDDDSDRVAYLTNLGYLSAEDKPKRRRKGADIDGDPDA